MRRLICAVGLMAVTSHARAAGPGVTPETIWMRGTNAWGGQGVHRVDSALASIPGDLTLSVGADFLTTTNLFIPGDSDTGSTSALHAVWTPIVGVQLGLSGSYQINNYSTFASYSVQSLGNPELHLKYGYELPRHVAVGAALHAILPTFRSGHGVGSTAFVGRAQLLASYHPLPFLEAAGNVGFVLDRSAAPFTSPPVAVQRFALGINDSDHFDFGAAVLGRIRQAYLAPFLEMSGHVGGSTLGAPITAVLTPGLRLDSSYGGVFEVAVGADIRLAGAPSPSSTFGGVPPWRVFAQLTLHVLTTPEARLAWQRTDCSEDRDCPAGTVCGSYAECVQPYRPSDASLTLPKVEKPTIVYHGRVRDVVTGAPVPKAKIIIEGFAQAPIQAEVGGAFVTFPLEASSKPVAVSVEAPGYVPTQQQVNLDVEAASLPLVLSMHPIEHTPGGHLIGAVHDRRSNEPVAGAKLFFPALKKELVLGRTAEFNELLPVGRLEVVITAPKYRAQRLHATIADGETVILNVDMFAGR